MFFIRQNATHKVVLGPAVAVGDGFTPVTTLSLSGADEAEAILHDNGTVVSISGYTFAAITTADGYYHLTLQSGISGTVGHLTIVVNDDSLILPLRGDFTVVEEDVYDAMFASSAVGNFGKVSDIHSRLVVVEAAIDSDQTSRTAAISDVKSLVVVVEAAIDSDQTSRTSAISDVHSRIVVVEASIDSDQVSRTTSISDVKSQLVTVASDTLAIEAKASDTHSRLVVVEAAIDSDQTSRATAISDVKSQLAIVASDTVVLEDAVVLASGTADSGTTTTMVDAARTEADTDYWKGARILFTSGTIDGQIREITDFTPATDTITFSPATTQAVGTNTYVILQGVTASGLSAGQDSKLTQVHSDSLVMEVKTSDTHSRLVVVESSIDSDQTSRTAAISDTKSLLTLVRSDTTAIESAGGSLTVAQDSKLTQVHSDSLVIEVKTSDTHSRLVVVEASIDSDQVSRTTAISDVKSQLTVVASDAALLEVGTPALKYAGPRGPGVYLNDAAANTNTTTGTDGIISNPVSTIAAAKTIADATGFDRIYLVNDTSVALGADTWTDYEFVGIGPAGGNAVALNSQDISGSAFYNLSISGVQTGSGRARFEDCLIGVATLHLFAQRCGFTNSASTGLTLSNNDDNILDSCFSTVPGNAAPIFTCTGAANLDLSVRHYSGGMSFVGANATATFTLEGHGQVIWDATTNVNSAFTLRGHWSETDNTGGMNNVTRDASYNRSQLTVIASDTLAIEAKASDTHSRLVVVESAIDSDQTSRTAAISDVHSRVVVVEAAIDSDQTSRATAISDTKSLLTLVRSDTTAIEAKASDTHSRLVVVEAAVDSDQTSRATAISDVHSRIVVVESAIDSDQTSRTAALSDIKSDIVLLQDAYVESTTKAGTLSTTVATTNLSESTDDHYIGCLLVFMDGVLAGQRTDVTDYSGTNGTLTFTALTEAPGAGDTFRLY